MNKYILGIIFSISIISLSCNDNSTNIIDVVEQYIKNNKLPITIGREITVNNDFNITDKTSFQVFILDLSNTLANNISEGHYNDDTIENYLELQRIMSGFYDSCFNNNYETAIIFTNIRNENKLLVNYLEYHNYNITFNNDFVILDNNINYTKLEKLIDALQQMGDITRNNIINYLLHDWNGKDTYIYKKIVFIDGMIGTVDINSFIYEPFNKESINGWFINQDIDLALEVGIMNVSYYMISSIINLFKIKGYDLKEYEITWEEIETNITEFQKIIDDYNSRDQMK
jgi:hypothetical protein